jgi:hypothetical protein
MDLYAAAGIDVITTLFGNVFFIKIYADYRYGDYGGMMESGTAAMEAITALLV